MKDAADPSTDPATGAPSAAIPAVARDFLPIIDDAIGRIHKRAQQEIEARRTKLTPGELRLLRAEYRAGVLQEYAALVLTPIATTLGRDPVEWAANELHQVLPPEARQLVAPFPGFCH